MEDELLPFERVIDLFLAGRLPGMNHARHIAVANLMRRLPHGRALMHLGLQVTAIRAGVPEKYDRAVTDACWDARWRAPAALGVRGRPVGSSTS